MDSIHPKATRLGPFIAVQDIRSLRASNKGPQDWPHENKTLCPSAKDPEFREESAQDSPKRGQLNVRCLFTTSGLGLAVEHMAQSLTFWIKRTTTAQPGLRHKALNRQKTTPSTHRDPFSLLGSFGTLPARCGKWTNPNMQGALQESLFS